MSFRHLGFAASLAAMLAVGVAVAPPEAHATSAHERAGAKLQRALVKLTGLREGPPGAIAVVQRGLERRVLRSGFANARRKTPLRVGLRWRIASASKAFSGAVALRLVAQGKLSLDESIAQRLPALPSAWGAVTLRQALHHTSGLPDYTKSEELGVAVASRKPAEPSTLISWVADQPLAFPPGSRYRYSNTDNVVVALMAEAATGLSYGDLLSALVYDSLTLRRTSMPLGYAMPAPFVHGYGYDDGRLEDGSELFNATLLGASGGIVSTPFDLTRFVRAYGGGRLFGGAARKAQTTFVKGESQPPGPGANSAGLALFRYRTPCGVVYGHTGNMPGYTAFMASSPNGRRSAVVHANLAISRTSGSPEALKALRRAFELAVCAALA